MPRTSFTGGDSNANYFITPNDASKSVCPNNQTCFTLEAFVTEILPHLNVKVVNMTFLSGNHSLYHPMKFANVQEVIMRGQMDISNGNSAEMHLNTEDITFEGAKLFQMSNLVIQGSGKYTLWIKEGQQNGKLHMTQLFLYGTSLQLNSYYYACPQLVVSHCRFVDSMIEVRDCQQDQWSTHITHSLFLMSATQSHTIAICSSSLPTKRHILHTVDKSITLEKVSFSESSMTGTLPSSRLPSICKYSTKYDSVDVYVADRNVELNIKSCSFNRKYGTAILVTNSPVSQFIIDYSNFTNYKQGALVFTDDIHGTIIILDNTNFTKNSIGTGNMASAAVLTVTPNSPFNVSTTVNIRDCLFEGNSDNVGNLQIIFLHALSYVNITDSTFAKNRGTAIGIVESVVTFSGDVLFTNNFAYQGGALAMKSSFINISDDTTIEFSNNSVTQFGGAIYILNPLFYLQSEYSTRQLCFYQPISRYFKGIELRFYNNSAQNGGDNIYGTSIKNYCKAEKFRLNDSELNEWHNVFNFTDEPKSSISSNPMRVCLCNEDGLPQCANEQGIFDRNNYFFPGESFNISVVIVGAEFGTTIGQVFANVVFNHENETKSFGSESQSIQYVTSNDKCTNLTYSIWSSNTYEIMYLTVADNTAYYGITEAEIKNATNAYKNSHVIPISLLITPVYLFITLIECPRGFSMNKHSYCSCSTTLKRYQDIDCIFENGTGYVSRKGTTWIGLMHNNENSSNASVVINEHCQFDHCTQESVQINLEDDQEINLQCAFNHSGVLCGGCKKNNSIAIGSSHCIYCSNNDNLALLIVFGTAGPLLYVLIATMSLTITQGFINSLLFYSNIVWIYQNILLPSTEDTENGQYYVNAEKIKHILSVLKAFMAWLNLDFGIEICFINGLDAFWKSLLQYIFPIYIWIIAAMVIVLYRCVNVQYFQLRFKTLAHMTSNPVDVLATFVLLSYTKLIRNIRDVLRFSFLKTYADFDATTAHTEIVWTIDGSINFLQHRHIVLFIAALTALVGTLIYTIYILVMGLKIYMCECKIDEHFDEQQRLDSEEQQEEDDEYQQCDYNEQRTHTCTRTKCHLGMMVYCMDMPLPLYNAHFASYDSKHRYWLGLTLLVRIALLLIFTVLSEVAPSWNLPILFTTSILLLFHTAWNNVHNKKSLRFLQSLSLCNLIFLSGAFQSVSLQECPSCKAIVVSISFGIALVQFLGIMGYRMIQCWNKVRKPKGRNSSNRTQTVTTVNDDSVSSHEEQEQEDTNRLRESLLNEESIN